MQSVPDLVAQGFALALVTYVFVWGMTIPIRWMISALGFRSDAE